MTTNHNAARRKQHSKKKKIQKMSCQSCRGRGKVTVPDLDGVSMSEIARHAGLSRSLVSRMLSDNVAPHQKRANPELDTMLKVCGAVAELTGTRLSLDALVFAIRG